MRSKKVISLLLAMVMCLAALPISVSAEAGETAEVAEDVTFTALDGTAGAKAAESYTMLLDGDTKTKWGVASFNDVDEAYVVIEASKAVVVTGYLLTTANDNASQPGRNPKDWVLYGANDYDETEKTATWTEIHTVKDDTTMQDVNYTAYGFPINDNTTAYRYYKLKITANRGANFMQLSELVFGWTEEITYQYLSGTTNNPQYLVDGDFLTAWDVDTAANPYVIFKTSKSVCVNGYNLTMGQTWQTPQKWVFYGSADYDETTGEGNWIPIDIKTSTPTHVLGQRYRFRVYDNNACYQYYMLMVTDATGSSISGSSGKQWISFDLAEMELNYRNAVCFDKNGGDTEAKPNGVLLGSLPAVNPVREGYLFDGWYTKSGADGDRGEAYTADTVLTGDMTVYAQWKPLTETDITLSTIDGSYDTQDSSSEDYTHLTDGDLTTKWCRTKFSANDYAVIKASKPFILTDYYIVTAEYSSVYPERIPKTWNLYGCNDYDSETQDGTWMQIHRVANDKTIDAEQEMTAFPFSVNNNTEAYQYYKLVIAANRGDEAMEIGELKMNQCAHSFSLNYLAPNCTESGYEEQSCSFCGYSYKKELAPVAEEHTWVDNSICSLCGVAAVAKTDTANVYYSSLQQAIDAAKEENDTVCLMQDVQTTSTVTVKSGELTLDLNGFVLSTTGSSVLSVSSGAKLTLKDTSKDQTGAIRGGTNANIKNGGGVYVSGTFTMQSGTIEDCSATSGGGVYVSGTFIMQGGTIENCSATNGGGVCVIGTFTMQGGTIKNCSATSGGGVQVNAVNTSTSFSMSGGKIENCSATNGGGLCVWAFIPSLSGEKPETNYAATLSGGSLVNNTADGNGGGIYIDEDAGITLSGAEISENKATNGGGIYQNSTGAKLTSGSITKNTAVADGGGVYLSETESSTTGELPLSTVTIGENNTGVIGGVDIGGVDIGDIDIGVTTSSDTKELTLGAVTISENSAGGSGGGLYAGGGSTVKAAGTVVTKNAAQSGGGVVHNAASFEADSAVQIDQNTVLRETKTYPSNLYLCSGKVLTMTDASVATGKIGVTFAEGNTGFVTTASSTDYTACFASDTEGYAVRLRDNRVKVVVLYTVTFNYTADIGTEETVADGDSAYLPTTTIKRNGYSFIGWFLNGDEYDFSTPVTENMTLTAVWISKTKPELILSSNTVYTANVPEGAMLFVAAYSGDKLLSLYRGAVTSGTTALNTLGLDLSGADKLSAFMWNGTSLSPLCDNASITLGTD